MLMPKKNRNAIYEHLFKEGVMVAEKDFNAPKHPELESVPNLQVSVGVVIDFVINLMFFVQVIKALTSLKSRGYVKEQFAWRHYYWSLTNEGIQYLRDYLHLPPEIVPATLKRQAPRETRPRASAAPRAGGVGKEADREAYRKAGDDKTGAAGPGSAPMQFRGGFGRGKPQE